jgi:hypothetical protein
LVSNISACLHTLATEAYLAEEQFLCEEQKMIEESSQIYQAGTENQQFPKEKDGI